MLSSYLLFSHSCVLFCGSSTHFIALFLDLYPLFLEVLIMCLQHSIQEKIYFLRDKILNLYTYRHETELYDCCDYVDTESCSTIITKLCDLSIVQLNIRGILGKQHELKQLLRSCTYLHRVDVVILEETWLTHENELRLNIPGYTYYGIPRIYTKGGGVGFLVNKRISFKKRPDLSLCDSSVENAFIEIKGRKSGIVLGALYRPSNQCDKQFLKDYSKLVSMINKDKCKSFVIGMDHN